jgi:hypothetical protein
MAQAGPDPLARFERPLPAPDAPFHVRVQWMRQGARLMVRTIALDAVLAPTGDHSRYVEAMGIVQAFGLRCRASNAEIIAATEGEWKAATDYCSRFIEALRRELWHRCRAGQPREAIMGAAQQIAMRFDMPIDDAQLVPVLAGIWSAAQPYKQKRGRYGARRR